MCIDVHVFRVSQDSEIIRVDPHLRCNTQIGLLGSDVRKVFPNDELFNLVLQKLTYCYDNFDINRKNYV